jgi:hypothetical protein
VSKAEASVEQLVDMIERRELELPEMQREYVWRSTRVRDLLDSLYRGYPSGVILAWRTNEPVARNEFAVETVKSPLGKSMLLLDGQQRLTSLSAVLRGELVQVRGRKRPIDILFNLDHPEDVSFVAEVDEDSDDDFDALSSEIDSEETDIVRRMRGRTFVVSAKALAAQPNWVSVTEVMKSNSDAEFLKSAGVTSLDDPRYEQYTRRLQRLRDIRNYMYRMDVLEESMSYEEVTEIFVRVNSLGAKLRSSDLALAQITARWPGSLEQFRGFQKECDELGFELDLSMFLRMMVALLTSQSRFKTVAGISREDLEGGWGRAERAMLHAINFLRSNAGIDSPALLASPFALIAIGYWADRRSYKPSGEEETLVRRWVLLANAKGRWSRGSSETILDQDLAVLRDGGGAEQLLERLLLQVGRLEVLPADLEGRNSRSALFKTMFLAFAHAGAQDWWSKLALSVKHAGAQDRLQFHHIFPKAYLRKCDPEIRGSAVDDIANLAFISGKTNRSISEKAPSDYLAALAKESPKQLERQEVPLDADLYVFDKYSEFLVMRRALIAQRLNAFLGTRS